MFNFNFYHLNGMMEAAEAKVPPEVRAREEAAMVEVRGAQTPR